MSRYDNADAICLWTSYVFCGHSAISFALYPIISIQPEFLSFEVNKNLLLTIVQQLIFGRP